MQIPVITFDKHAIEHADVRMQMQVETRPEPTDERDRTNTRLADCTALGSTSLEVPNSDSSTGNEIT